MTYHLHFPGRDSPVVFAYLLPGLVTVDPQIFSEPMKNSVRLTNIPLSQFSHSYCIASTFPPVWIQLSPIISVRIYCISRIFHVV